MQLRVYTPHLEFYRTPFLRAFERYQQEPAPQCTNIVFLADTKIEATIKLV